MPTVLQKARHFINHSGLLWKNRSVLPRVMSGYFNTLILKKPVLRTVEFAITANCNVNCTMCYATKLVDRKRPPMSPDDYANVWQQARELGAFTVHLSGGEPTLRKDLPKILDALSPGKPIISMTTNSSLITPVELALWRSKGLSVLHFSLNSMDENLNDAQRDHKGHQQMVFQMIQDAKNLGYEVCLSVVIAHGQLDGMRNLTDFAKSNDIGIVFSLATPSGNWKDEKNQMLTPAEWKEVDTYMDSNPHIRSDWTINLDMKKGCPAGYEKVAISPYGEVQGCAMIFISHGNVLDRPLKEIYGEMREWAPFEARPDKCLIGLDEKFVDEYVIPANSFGVLPVPLNDHPAGKNG